ncbi:COX15/CtaA family protein [Corynebacterium guangdongense]|uniref:Cytochrome c oxidase assembly protein subunit 15 n=1 Tax=Corynebacterium guangdongense TaxID=1783348 RepID=A0ABU1ZWT0_9CORY|nr:heme A synthase [Corynebacterium guangdongense]MDR7329386.1 cytochrome c oxidase assembly protein subunit 15 [Corynebacterium guangdongense]WJZ17951.1 Heme A synthase [Corynebacterium guangdongense]
MSTSTTSSSPARRTPTGTGPSLRLQRILALVLLIAQGSITVTGSIVRVTGSGLGCDTWPNCHEGSLVPMQGAAPAIHQAIEFGNRLLTFVLAAIALALFIAVLRAHRRSEILWLSFLSGLGVIVQAVIGGISVLLDLQWWAVAIHFLPSMILVWIAALLYMRIAEPDAAEPVRRFPGTIRTLALVAAIALSLVLVTGTMVTGSGPHSGDAGVGMDGRLELDTKMLAYVHAASMYLYLGLTIITVVMLHRTRSPRDAVRTSWVLIAMIVIQWAIGVTQFYLGVPRWTVPAHIAMSSVVVAFTAFLWAHGRRRLPVLT